MHKYYRGLDQLEKKYPSVQHGGGGDGGGDGDGIISVILFILLLGLAIIWTPLMVVSCALMKI